MPRCLHPFERRPLCAIIKRMLPKRGTGGSQWDCRVLQAATMSGPRHSTIHGTAWPSTRHRLPRCPSTPKPAAAPASSPSPGTTSPPSNLERCRAVNSSRLAELRCCAIPTVVGMCTRGGRQDLPCCSEYSRYFFPCGMQQLFHKVGVPPPPPSAPARRVRALVATWTSAARAAT